MREIEHLKRRFANKNFYVNNDDVKALNGIIKQFNELQSETLRRNKLFIKLFISTFLDESVIREKTAHQALDEIKRLLSIPTSEYYDKMRFEVPLLRLQRLSEKKGILPLYEKKNGKIVFHTEEERKKVNDPIIRKYQKEMDLALTTEYTEKELNAFIDKTIFSLLTNPTYLT